MKISVLKKKKNPQVKVSVWHVGGGRPMSGGWDEGERRFSIAGGYKLPLLFPKQILFAPRGMSQTHNAVLSKKMQCSPHWHVSSHHWW